MKTMGIFTIIVIILSATAIVKADDNVCKGVPDGNARPNIDDCEKFFVCLGDKGIPKDCGNGLHFNPKLLFCQKPEDAGCRPQPTKPPTQPTSAPPTKPPTQPPTQPPTKPPTQPPTQPPTKPPTQPPTKPPTQPPTQPPTKPPTQPPTRPPTKPPQPTNQPIPIPPGICKSHPLGHKINYPNDCTKFIVCIGGGVGFECPDGLHFNYAKQVCDWKESAGCQ